MTPGCWACPIPADRHGGEGRNPRCHPGREWRSGPDSLLCGHLNCPLQHDLTCLNGTTEVKRCINASTPVNKTNGRKLQITNLLHALQSGHVLKELEKIKNPSLTSGCVTENDLTHMRLHSRIIVHPGRMLLMQTAASPRIQSHTTCLLQICKTRRATWR